MTSSKERTIINIVNPVCYSEWLAGLLRHGLLRSSFIPPKEVRIWRDLTRMRRKYVNSMSDYKKRVQKLFESANIKN